MHQTAAYSFGAEWRLARQMTGRTSAPSVFLK